MMNAQRLSVVFVAVLVLSALAPAVAVATADAPTHASLGPASATPLQASNNSTTPAESASDQPPIAETARVTAVSFDEDYLRTSRTDANTFNTTGPYAVFAVSQNVEAARVTEPKADAKVLDGGRTVRVSYADDAAPEGQRSLYTLELYFEDGSKRTFDLYASQTDQVVASAAVKEAQDLLDQMRDDAEEDGYEPTLEGIEAHYEQTKEDAEFFSNVFGPQFKALFAWIIFTVQTPFAVIGGAIVIIIAAWRILKIHGHKIRSLQQGIDLIEQARQTMYLTYREQQDAADEERLEDVPEIGPLHIYWQDAFGVQSVKQLADEFAWGRPATDEEGNIIRDTDADPLTDDDGNVLRWSDGSPVYPAVMQHHGIADLRRADSLRDTWLEPVIRRDMLGDGATALAHAKRALMRMTTHHGQPQYREARAKTRELLKDIEQARSPDGGASSQHQRRRSAPRGAAAGGDD